MMVYTLPSPTPLERAVQHQLSPDISDAQWTTYPNKENMVVVAADLHHEDVIILGRTSPPTQNIFRTLLLIDAIKNAGAKSITVAIPYFGYARHDRPFAPGGSCAAPLIAALLRTAGATSIIAVDIHSGAIEKAGAIPLHNLSMLPAMAECMKSVHFPAATIASPDHGGIQRAETFAREYGNATPVIWCEKHRKEDGKVSTTTLHGEVIGNYAIIVDDMLDTGRTVEAAAELLRSHGAEHLALCVTHPLFTGPALERIRNIGFEHIVTTNTVPLRASMRRLENIVVLNTRDLLVDVLSAKHSSHS